MVRRQLTGIILRNTGMSGKERIQRRRIMSTAAGVNYGSTAATQGGSIERWSKNILASSLLENPEKLASLFL